MAYFDGLSSSAIADRLRADVTELFESFRDWRERVDNWDRYAFPDTTPNLLSPLDYARYSLQRQALPGELRSKYVSEWIRTRIDTVVNLMTRAKTRITPTLLEDDEADQRRLGDMVRAGIGFFNYLEWQNRHGYSSYSDAALKRQITELGKAVAFVHVRAVTPGSSVGTLDVRLYDPHCCYHDLEGLPRRFVYEKMVPVRLLPSLYQQFGIPVPADIYGRNGLSRDAKDVKVTDYWLEERDPDDSQKMRVWNGVLVNNSPLLGAGVRLTRFQRLPFKIVHHPESAREFQTVDGRASKTYLLRHAAPFYAPAINVVKQEEILLGLLMDAAALTVLQPRMETPGDSDPQGITGPGDVRPGGKIVMRPGDKIELLEMGGKVVQIQEMLQQIALEKEAIFPSILAVIQSSPGDPALLHNSKISQARSFMVPWTRMAESMKVMILDEIFLQHREANLTFRLHGKQMGVEDAGGMFFLDWTSADYPKGHWVLNVEEPEEFPFDVRQNAFIYESMVRSGSHDPVSARVEVYGMENPQEMDDRVRQAQVRDMPEMKMLAMLETLRQRQEALQAEADRARSPEGKTALRIQARAAGLQRAALEQRLLGTGPQETGTSPGAPVPGPEVQPADERSPNIEEPSLVMGRQTGRQGRPRPQGTR